MEPDEYLLYPNPHFAEELKGWLLEYCGQALPMSLEDIERAKDQLDRRFEAYLASLSARSLSNLKPVEGKLYEFRQVADFLRSHTDDLIHSEVSWRREEARREAARIQV